MKYLLDSNNYVVACGNLATGIDVTDKLPFDINTYWMYKYDSENSEWIYLPDITDINTTIENVIYNWNTQKAYITIADIYRPGPYEFDCTEDWISEDCQNAIDNYFNN